MQPKIGFDGKLVAFLPERSNTPFVPSAVTARAAGQGEAVLKPRVSFAEQ